MAADPADEQSAPAVASPCGQAPQACDGSARRRGDAGSVAYELVLMMPVLVLLTVFVLWAAGVGRVVLVSDLAAEEAATAAALCCEEDEPGAADREQLVRDVIESRPGLAHLCIGGPRPGFPPPGDGSSGATFVSEHWLAFESFVRADTGGVGIVTVRLECETDGAVATLQGLLPTGTVNGHATEVVTRR